jgi:hypothetical protein
MMLSYCCLLSVFVLSYVYGACCCTTISCCSRICGEETDSCTTIFFRVIDCVLRVMFMYTLVIYLTRLILVV